MKFYSILFEHENLKITLEPYRAFKISDDANRLLIIYSINHYNLDQLVKSSKITYYMSDGNTNRLRANMIFPMLCFHTENNKSCITIQGGTHRDNYNLLVKASGINNLNLDDLNDQIMSQSIINNFEKFSRERKTQTTNDSVLWEKAHRYLTNYVDMSDSTKTTKTPTPTIQSSPRYIVDANIGILSILPRITNLIDFVLSIHSDQLINLVDMEFYVPIPYEFYNGVIDYFDFSESNRSLGIKKSDVYPFYTDQLKKTEDTLRINLINKLNHLIRLLVSTNIFTVTQVELEPELISKERFNNRFAKICNNNSANPGRVTNFENYKNISSLFFDNVKLKINGKIQQNAVELTNLGANKSSISPLEYQVSKEELENKTNNLNEFKKLLSMRTTFSNIRGSNGTFLDSNIKAWQGTCDKN